MELIHFDADLLLNERQITCTRDSIMKMKKRLHDTQLTLILEPSENEQSEMDDWEVKVHELINRREKLDFPSMRAILREKKEEETSAIPMTTLLEESPGNRERPSITQEQVWERMKKAELRKRLGKESTSFGASPTGEILRTIDNYKGTKSAHPTSRTLVRKHHIPGPFDNTSSVPSWVGPGQYDKIKSPSATPGKDIGFQIAFRAIPRDKVATADLIRDTAMQRNILSPHRDLLHNDSNYFLRQSDRDVQQSIMGKSFELRPGSRQLDSRSSDVFSSSSEFKNDPDEYAIRSLVRTAKFGKGHESDQKNSSGLNSSIKLNSLVESLAKSSCFKEFEVKDYTLGALSSLYGKSENMNDDEDVFVPDKNFLDGNFRPERRESCRSGGGKRSTCGESISGMSMGLSMGRGSPALSTTGPVILPQGSTNRPQNNVTTQPGVTQQQETKKASLWPEERQYSFIKNNKKQGLNPRNKGILKSTQSRGPLFSRESTRTVKRVYTPLAKPFTNNVHPSMFSSSRKLSYRKSGEIGSSDDFDELSSDRIQSPSQINFPPLEGDLRPALDKWYIENNLYIPTQPKSTIRSRSLEFIASGSSSPLANTIALAVFNDERKAATYTPKKNNRKTHGNSNQNSLSISSVDMNGIFLPPESIDSAVSSQLFASRADFHSFIKENKMENDILFDSYIFY